MGRVTLAPLQRSSLGDWFATDAGRYVLNWELAQVDIAVEDIFGFNAAQIGSPGLDYLRSNRIRHRFAIGLEGAGPASLANDQWVPAGAARPTAHQDPRPYVRASLDQLPIASASLDLIILPHVLEFCADPHQVLREAERLLMAEGQIVISGFNPLSMWGLAGYVGGRSPAHPWRGEFIGLSRLRDWLKLLGFELNGGRFGCYAPPFSQAKWLNRCRFLETAGDRWWPITGGVYVVRAVKRTAGMRLVTPVWRQRRAAAPTLVSVARRDARPTSLRVIDGKRLPNPLAPTLPGARPVLRPVPVRRTPRADADT